MKHILSGIYLPNEIQLAHDLADALEDRKSLAFYLHCSKNYLRNKYTKEQSYIYPN